MKTLTASQMELLASNPKVMDLLLNMAQTMGTVTNVNIAEEVAVDGLQKVGQELMRGWLESHANERPLPKVRRHSKKN